MMRVELSKRLTYIHNIYIHNVYVLHTWREGGGGICISLVGKKPKPELCVSWTFPTRTLPIPVNFWLGLFPPRKFPTPNFSHTGYFLQQSFPTKDISHRDFSKPRIIPTSWQFPPQTFPTPDNSHHGKILHQRKILRNFFLRRQFIFQIIFCAGGAPLHYTPVFLLPPQEAPPTGPGGFGIGTQANWFSRITG